MIVDLDQLNSKNDKVFFGEYSGFQRYDNPAFPRAVKLEEAMRNAFWNPNEISMRDDAVKFFEMPKPVQDAMISIWMYQTLMDSSQNEGLEETICQMVTNPEYEALFKTWAYFELIHSISYSHIIRGIFTDSVGIFEQNMNNASIIERIRTEVEAYSDIAKHCEELSQEGSYSEENAKRVIELILTIYALEGIKFYASFLYTYLIHDRYGSLPGATRIIKLINFDEDSHTNASTVVLSDLANDPNFAGLLQSEWYQEVAHKTFKRVLEDEKSFAGYLRDVLGEHSPISAENTDRFLECYVDRRLQTIGVRPLGDEMVDGGSIVGWFDRYKDLNTDNAALQESDLAVYNVGTLNDDL